MRESILARVVGAAIIVAAICAPALTAGAARAQGAQVALDTLHQDTGLPVEIEADRLAVDNADGSALFSGDVRVRQGEMRLAAAEVRVEYDREGKAITRLHATGGVTLATPAEAAEAGAADYTVVSGVIVLTGDVVLTQNGRTLSGARLTIDLAAGTGVMEGRVTTTFVPAAE